MKKNGNLLLDKKKKLKIKLIDKILKTSVVLAIICIICSACLDLFKSRLDEKLVDKLMLIFLIFGFCLAVPVPILVSYFSSKDKNFLNESAFGHKFGKPKIYSFDYNSYYEIIDYVENTKKWKNVHKNIKFNRFNVDIFAKIKNNAYTRALIFQVFIKATKIEQSDFEIIKEEFEKFLIDNYGDERKEIFTWFILCIDKETPYFNEITTSYCDMGNYYLYFPVGIQLDKKEMSIPKYKDGPGIFNYNIMLNELLSSMKCKKKKH